MSISYFTSSIGKKQIMAVSGLGLALFVLAHMAGNLLLFVGADIYNLYSYKLISNPLIYVAEAGLIAIVLFHIYNGISLSFKNRAARNDRYAVNPSGDKAASLASKTMIHQGIVITVFIVHHLITFKFGPYYETTVDGIVMRDLYTLVIEVFQSPLYILWYLIATALVGFHLSHGVYSSCITLGLSDKEKMKVAKNISIVYGLVVSIGFFTQPIYAFLQG